MCHYQRFLVAALYLMAAMGIGTSLLSYPEGAPHKDTKSKEVTMKDAKLDEQIIRVVREYVKKTRGWQEKEYTYELFNVNNEEAAVYYIKEELRRDPAQVLVIDVIYLEDLDLRRRAFPVGGGKSFTLFIDRKTLKVLAELGWQ
jgi:hypothetical protein